MGRSSWLRTLVEGRLFDVWPLQSQELETPQGLELLNAQADFLRDHLLAWAPQCLALVVAHAETDYYRGTARLALGSLAESVCLCGAARLANGFLGSPSGMTNDGPGSGREPRQSAGGP